MNGNRNGTFKPQIVKKYQTTISNEIEEKILSMYGLGMSYTDISAHISQKPWIILTGLYPAFEPSCGKLTSFKFDITFVLSIKSLSSFIPPNGVFYWNILFLAQPFADSLKWFVKSYLW